MYYLKYFKTDVLTLNVSCGHTDSMPLFGRYERKIYLIFNHTLDFNKIYTQQNHCLNSLQQPFFQSVTFAKVPKLALPNGLIATLSGPYEGNTMIALGFMSQICWRIWNNLHGLLIIPYIPMGIQPTPWVPTSTHHISKAKTMRTR